LDYSTGIKVVSLAMLTQNTVTITAAYFFYTHDIRSFVTAACLFYIIQLVAGVYCTIILYQAAIECQTLISSGPATSVTNVMSGFNESLFSGKGQVHADVQRRRKAIVEACGKLEKDVKWRALSWGILNTVGMIAIFIAMLVVWDSHDGLSYSQYAAYGLFGFASFSNQAVAALPRASHATLGSRGASAATATVLEQDGRAKATLAGSTVAMAD